MGARIPVNQCNLYRSGTLHKLFELFPVSSWLPVISRGTLWDTNIAHCTRRPARRSSSLADVRSVQDLPFRNNELADAVEKDRAMARVRLYDRLMPDFEEAQHLQQAQLGLAKPRAAIPLCQLKNFAETDIKTLLKPCVARDDVLHGDEATLRQRLAAVLHFTGLHEQYPVDLQDMGSMDAIAEEFTSASQAGMVLSYAQDANTAQSQQKRSCWQQPVSLKEARKRTQKNCSEPDQEEVSLVPVRDFASLLVDAGFEDVLSVNVSKLSDQRDFDVLLLATGRSPQHAFAGAKALRYLLKQTRKAHGLHRPVAIADDGVAAWFSVTSGPVSVHCMSREVREQLDLEDLWGKGADLTWYQKGPSVLTLDSIGAGPDSDDDRDSDRDSDQVHEGKHDDESTDAGTGESR